MPERARRSWVFPSQREMGLIADATSCAVSETSGGAKSVRSITRINMGGTTSTPWAGPLAEMPTSVLVRRFGDPPRDVQGRRVLAGCDEYAIPGRASIALDVTSVETAG